MKEPIIETEPLYLLEEARLNPGGVLELKNGEWCLRLSDELWWDRMQWRVTRRWDPPDCEPWDRAFYRRVGA